MLSIFLICYSILNDISFRMLSNFFAWVQHPKTLFLRGAGSHYSVYTWHFKRLSFKMLWWFLAASPLIVSILTDICLICWAYWPIRWVIVNNGGLVSTNEKIRFYKFNTTPWINESISRKFSVGGGWGLGWAKSGCLVSRCDSNTLTS